MAEHILVVEDEAHVRQFIEVHLRLEGYSVRGVGDGEAALEAIAADPPALALLDIALPGIDGLEVCRNLRADPHTSHTPVIFLTGRAHAMDKLQGLSAGANDYILKPFDPLELVARVRTTLDRARELRTISPLTGLPGNHRIHHELAFRVARGEPVAVAYADISGFKPYNDRYGFLQGDAVIVMTAQLAVEAVKRYAPDTGFVGHIGGDDFVLICPPDVVERVCQDLIAAFDERVPGLYSPEDAARGWVELPDRRGQLQRWPLVSLGVGVAQAREGGEFTDHRELVEVAVEMKTFVKSHRVGSDYALDDRRRPIGAPVTTPLTTP